MAETPKKPAPRVRQAKSEPEKKNKPPVIRGSKEAQTEVKIVPADQVKTRQKAAPIEPKKP
jgi:hypothetical protein